MQQHIFHLPFLSDRESSTKLLEKKNKTLIARVAKEFEIDPIVLVAIVGVETNYGLKNAEFSVINSLYTQALKMPKRSSWATKEIAELLAFCSENEIDPSGLNKESSTIMMGKRRSKSSILNRIIVAATLLAASLFHRNELSDKICKRLGFDRCAPSVPSPRDHRILQGDDEQAHIVVE